MNQEQRFFESCAATLSPDWCVQLSDQLTPGQINLADRTVRLYLVDTSRDWIAAGAFAPGGFRMAADAATAAGLHGARLADAAGQMLATLSRNNTTSGREIGQCLQLVAAAMTDTRSFQVVTEQGRGLAGHWVYLAYRCLDQSVTCRPLYFNANAHGFVPAATLIGVLRQVVRQDTRATTGTVAQMLRKAGGALLAPSFQ